MEPDLFLGLRSVTFNRELFRDIFKAARMLRGFEKN